MGAVSRLLPHELGGYLREQRESAELSLRQLADLAGISNPYLSQIERGLKRPSAEILSQLARGLKVSAESLYVRAGLLDDNASSPLGEPRHAVPTVADAIAADEALTDAQREALLAVYRQFVASRAEPLDPPPARVATTRPARHRSTAAAAPLPPIHTDTKPARRQPTAS